MAKSVNKRLSNSFVTMTANLQRLSETERLVVVGTLKDLEADLSSRLLQNPGMTEWRKARYNAMMSQCRETIKTAYEGINTQTQGYLSGVAGISAAGAKQAFNGIGIPVQSVALTNEQLKTLASRTLIEGAPSSAWWAKQSRGLQDSFLQQMRMGYANGETVDELVQRVRGTATGKRNTYIVNGQQKVFSEFSGGIMDTGTRQAEALVRTSTQQISNEAKMEFFRKNSDIIKGVAQVSTLDLRTTPQCAARDGKMWDLQGNPIGHKIPWLGGTPLHWNCRSTEVPVTKSFEELGATPGVDKDYLEQIGQGTRASMDGQVPAIETFDSWFQDLPEMDQVAYLGPKKFELWKDYGLTFSEMTDQRGNPLTLQQLADAYGFRLAQSMLTGMPNIPPRLEHALVADQAATYQFAKDLTDTAYNISSGRSEITQDQFLSAITGSKTTDNDQIADALADFVANGEQATKQSKAIVKRLMNAIEALL